MSLVVAIALLLGLIAFKLLFRSGSEEEAVVYLDNGKHKTLVSDIYRIRVKPDKLSKNKSDSITLTEYKSRPKKIYPSDRAQIIAGTLAARESGYDVRKGLLETGGGHQYRVSLSKESEQLFEQIRPAVESARLVKAGGVPMATPAIPKCRGCPYKAQCRFAR